MLTVAETADGQVAGVHGMSYVEWSLAGERRRFAVSVAAATDPGFRGKGVFRALEALHDDEAAATGAGVGLAYNPSAASWPIFVGAAGWSALGSHRVWARPVWRLLPRRADAVEVEALARIPDGLDPLWEQVSVPYGWAAARTAGYLSWRYLESPRRYTALAARRQGRLAGLAVVGTTVRRGVPLATLADLVAADGDDETVRALLAACSETARRAGARALVALAPPPSLRATFLRCGLVPSPVSLRIAARALQPAARLDGPWRFTLGDFDFV